MQINVLLALNTAMNRLPAGQNAKIEGESEGEKKEELTFGFTLPIGAW